MTLQTIQIMVGGKKPTRRNLMLISTNATAMTSFINKKEIYNDDSTEKQTVDLRKKCFLSKNNPQVTHLLTEPIITRNLNIFVITKMHSTDKKQTNDLKEISLLPKNAYVIHVLTKNYQPMVRSLNVFTKHLTVHALDKQQLAKPSEPASTSRYLERLNSKSEFIDLGFLSNTFNINIMR